MAKLLSLESVPGLSRADANDPLFRNWLERIARNTEQQSKLLRRSPSGTTNPQADASGLVVNVASVSSIAITADEVWVKDSDNNPEVLTAINTTVALATILDTGSVAINTWYYLYLIYNGSASRILASLSPTGPAMPEGYTHKGLLTAVRTSGAGALPISFTQGRRTEITEVAVLINGTATVATAVSVATAAPPIGMFVFGYIQVDSTVAGARAAFVSLDGTRGRQLVQDSALQTTVVGCNFHVAYTSSQVVYQGLVANNRTSLTITGWEF